MINRKIINTYIYEKTLVCEFALPPKIKRQTANKHKACKFLNDTRKKESKEKKEKDKG